MAINDYEPLIKKLAGRTEMNKLAWKPTAEKQTFVATLEGYAFEVSQIGEAWREFRLLMRDSDDNELVKIVATNTDPYNSNYRAEDRYFESLHLLYEEARQSALEVPKKISEVEGLLER